MSQFLKNDVWSYLDNDDPDLNDCQNGLHECFCRHARKTMSPPTLAEAVQLIKGLRYDLTGYGHPTHEVDAFLKRVEARHG